MCFRVQAGNKSLVDVEWKKLKPKDYFQRPGQDYKVKLDGKAPRGQQAWEAVSPLGCNQRPVGGGGWRSCLVGAGNLDGESTSLTSLSSCFLVPPLAELSQKAASGHPGRCG